jgi:hypothetical protein
MTYEEKQNQRREYYELKAQSLGTQSNEMCQRSVNMAKVIPMGQPIMVGHHSERVDRNYREKINNAMRKSIDLENKAEYYQRKAQSVGTGGISSLDENAIDKLKLQLTERQNQQELYKAHNKKAKKEGTSIIEGFLLTNNNANINRIKKRIAELEKISIQEDKNIKYDGFTYKEQNGRIMFEFDGKPAEHIRNLLKTYSFKWSPTQTAWVRMLNSNSLRTTKFLISALIKEIS